MTRAALVIAFLVGIFVLAGCGGGGGSSGERLTKAEYQQQVTELGADLEEEFSDISEADADDFAQLPALMDRLGEAVDAVADGFAELNPPEEIEAEHARFIAAARATADDARELSDRIETVPLTELAADPEELDISKSGSFLELQDAMEDITAKGYEFGDMFDG